MQSLLGGTFPPMHTTDFMVYAFFSLSLLIVVSFRLLTIAVGFAIVVHQGVCITELICILCLRPKKNFEEI